LVGALLHDAGKMLEFTLRDGVPAYADNADLIRHPLSGAILAAKHQLPDEIIHLIANHSFEGEKSKKTLISTILNQADAAAFSYIVMIDEQLQNEMEVKV
jgi:putative nucleotidyltransferase with HDIG domain